MDTMRIISARRRGLLFWPVLLLLISAVWGCTNSKPVRPEDTSVIYVSISSLYFTNPSQEIRFYMRYLGGYGSLSWHVSSQPDWAELDPSSGYLTGENQYVTARLVGAVVSSMAKGTYSGLVTIYSSEGTKSIPVSFVNGK